MKDPGVWLQGFGLHISKPADEVKVGDTLVWNYGLTSVVESISDISPKFLLFSLRSDGKLYPRRMKKDRRVAFINK